MENIYCSGISHVRAVFFECHAQQINLSPSSIHVVSYHLLDHLFHHVAGHGIIDTASGSDDFRMIAQFLCLINEIVRVYANAMAAHQSGLESQRIPLGIHSLQHFIGVDVHQVERNGQFIHKGNIDISLGIFHQLSRFGHQDGRHWIDASFNDCAIHLLHCSQRFLIHSRDNFHNVFQGMDFVSWIDSFWRITDFEIRPARHVRFFF